MKHIATFKIIAIIALVTLFTGCQMTPSYPKRDAWLKENPPTNHELHSIDGVTLGVTTPEEILALGASHSTGRLKWIAFSLNGLSYFDHGKFGVIRHVSIYLNDKMPTKLKEHGYYFGVSYEEWIKTLLSKGYVVDIVKKPTCVNRKDGSLAGLEADVEAYDENLLIKLNFGYGEKCDTNDDFTLYSLWIEYIETKNSYHAQKIASAVKQQQILRDTYLLTPFQVATQAYETKKLNECVVLCGQSDLLNKIEAQSLKATCLNEISEAILLLNKAKQQTSNNLLNEAEQTLIDVEKKWSDSEDVVAFKKELASLQEAEKNKILYMDSIDKGKKMVASKNYERAEVYFETAFNISQNETSRNLLYNSRYHTNLAAGKAFMHKGLWKKATSIFKKAQSYNRSEEVSDLISDSKKVQTAIEEWQKEKWALESDLNDEVKKLNSYWSQRLEDSWQNFLATMSGAGTHVHHERTEIERQWRNAEDRLEQSNRNELAQWEKYNPKPTMESVLVNEREDASITSANRTASTNIPAFNGSIIEFAKNYSVDAKAMKKIHYKSTYADLTSELPDVFYGKYVFEKPDTPGFNRTYQFNANGTGYLTSYTKKVDSITTKTIKSWGVMVENNKVVVVNVATYGSNEKKEPAMVIVYQLSEGEVGVTNYLMFRRSLSVMGPYNSPIQKQ